MRRYGDWSVRMTLRDENIDLRLGTEATRERVLAEKPDALIIAVGSEPIIPKVPGVGGANVCLAQDIDLGLVKPGKRVVIVGAGLTGTETAISLKREGHEVTVLDMLTMAEIRSREKAVNTAQRLANTEGVQFLEKHRLVSITPEGVTALDGEGREAFLPCDTVALSLGVRPRSKAVEELEDICQEVYVVGDCNNRQGNITSAVREGFYAAMNI